MKSVDDLPESVVEAVLNGEDLPPDSPARDFPFYPLNSPGMPDPGLGVIEYVEAVEDRRLFERKSNATKVKPDVLAALKQDPALAKAYWRLLYPSPSMRMKVTASKRQYSVQVVPGHLWDPDFAEDGVTLGPIHPATDHPVVMVVGKMPGKEEVAQFRSLAGNLADYLQHQLLTFCGVEYDQLADWYVTTAVKWSDPRPSGGSLPKSWIKDCSPVLHQEMRLVLPDYILCLGSEASQAITGVSKLSTLQGRVLDLEFPIHKADAVIPEVHRAQVVCVTNPGAVLHNPDIEDQFLFSLKTFTDLVLGVEREDQEKNVEIVSVTTLEHLKHEVDLVLAQPGLRVIAVDGEWHGEVWNDDSYLRTIQFCSDGDRAICIELTGPGGDRLFDAPDSQIATELRRLFYADSIQLCGSFFNADEPWLEKLGVPLSMVYTVPPDVDDLNGGDYTGGFDVALAAHAYDETGNFGLEMMGMRFCYAKRWDVELDQWLEAHCRRNKIKKSKLNGYGDVPRDILLEYGGRDVIYTWRLRREFCTLLHADQHGNNCWKAFHTSMSAFPAFGEISKEGLYTDIEVAQGLSEVYSQVLDERMNEFKESIGWGESFNPRSLFCVRELLYGENLNRKVPGGGIRIRPPGAISLGLTPVLAAGKRPQPWARVVRRGVEEHFNPSTNSVSLGLLVEEEHKLGEGTTFVQQLRDYRYLDQVIKTFLGQPKANQKRGAVWDKGNLRFIRDDLKVHTFMIQTKETGRASSVRPNIMALSKRREKDYARILREQYTVPIRCVFVANDPLGREEPHVFVEADFSTAELLMVGVQARDENMIAHCLDPEYDIHSHIAVEAFRLDCEPTKKGVENCRPGIRNAAKSVVFGSNYLQQPEGLTRNINQEGGIKIEVRDAEMLQQALYRKYDRIPIFQQDCKNRVDNEGWVRSCTGRLRRFGRAWDEKTQEELRRQSTNFPIQNPVADIMSRVMTNFYWDETKDYLNYRVVAQIHDSLVFRVPVRSLDEFCSDTLPRCMVDTVSFRSCDLNGVPYGGEWADREFHFSIEYSVMERWGLELEPQDCTRLGISESYLGDIPYVYGEKTLVS